MHNYDSCFGDLASLVALDPEQPILAVYYNSKARQNSITWLLVYRDGKYVSDEEDAGFVTKIKNALNGSDLTSGWSLVSYCTNPTDLKRGLAANWDVVTDLAAAIKAGECRVVLKRPKSLALAESLAKLLNITV